MNKLRNMRLDSVTLIALLSKRQAGRMLIHFTQSPSARLRLARGLMIASISALLGLSALASPLHAKTVSLLLGIQNVSATWAPLPAEGKRRLPGVVSASQSAVSVCFTAAQPPELEAGEETVCFGLPSAPPYQGINQHSKPPPQLLEHAITCQ